VIEVNVDTSEVIPEIEGPITAVGLGYGTFESVVKIVTNLTITGARVMLKTNLTASSAATDVEKGGRIPYLLPFRQNPPILFGGTFANCVNACPDRSPRERDATRLTTVYESQSRDSACSSHAPYIFCRESDTTSAHHARPKQFSGMKWEQCTAFSLCSYSVIAAGIALMLSPAPIPQGPAMHATLGGTEWLAAAGVLYGLYQLWYSAEDLRPTTDEAGKSRPRVT
jgi:hypothetical protein